MAYTPTECEQAVAGVNWTCGYCEFCDPPKPAPKPRYEVINGACIKCGGSGRVDRFSHVLGGECFRCGGTGHAYRRVA